jgi:hypothetical protein
VVGGVEAIRKAAVFCELLYVWKFQHLHELQVI